VKQAALITPLWLAACSTGPAGLAYEGVAPLWLGDNIAQVTARMRGIDDNAPVLAYAECGLAQYALDQGFGFARQIRTNVIKEGGIWTADAVYSVSPSLPQGLDTIDVEVTVEACAENGIPVV